MATLTLTITGELELIHDAIADFDLILRAIVKCHGSRFRALEQRIERFMERESEWGEPDFHNIGGGHFIMEPWPEMKAIIRQARDLGVIQ